MGSSREEWKGSKNDEDNDFRKEKTIWMDSFRTIVIKIKLFIRLTPHWRWYQEIQLKLNLHKKEEDRLKKLFSKKTAKNLESRMLLK